jgi:tripartite-type tricarboxylate transporter receptor subunit TctC
MNRLSTIGLILLAGLGSPSLCAEGPSPSLTGFPSKPIRWIVPFPPGGPTDVVARIIGQRLGEHLKQPVLVENRPGAFGNIGLEAAARAAPDGHTIVHGTTNVPLTAALYHRLRFDPLTELTAVAPLTTTAFVLLASADFPATTIPEVLAAAKAKPGMVTCGWGAPLFQLACELLKVQGKVEIRAVPYKGNAPAMTDLISGRIKLLFDAPNTALPQVKANRVRAIATTGPRRAEAPLHDLPAVSETLAGFELLGWQGVLAPAGTPREIVNRLNREIGGVLAEEEVRKRLTDSGLEVAPGSPEALTEMLRQDYAKFSKIIRDAGIKPE